MRIGACLQDVRLERFPGLSLEKSADVGPCIGRSPPEASSPRGSGIREAPGTPGHAPAISVRSLCRSARPPRLKAFRTSPRAIREIAGSAAPRVWPAIPRPRLLARRRGGATAQGALPGVRSHARNLRGPSHRGKDGKQAPRLIPSASVGAAASDHAPALGSRWRSSDIHCSARVADGRNARSVATRVEESAERRESRELDYALAATRRAWIRSTATSDGETPAIRPA